MCFINCIIRTLIITIENDFNFSTTIEICRVSTQVNRRTTASGLQGAQPLVYRTM